MELKAMNKQTSFPIFLPPGVTLDPVVMAIVSDLAISLEEGQVVLAKCKHCKDDKESWALVQTIQLPTGDILARTILLIDPTSTPVDWLPIGTSNISDNELDEIKDSLSASSLSSWEPTGSKQ
jgi:hypothetical protein